MGTKYTDISISGYNSSPPADDASATEANKVKWSTIKTKLPDPIKTLAESINTSLVTAFDYSTVSKTATYTATAADHMKTIECDGTFTVTLGAAASMGAGYLIRIKNIGTGTVTVDGNGSETIDDDTTITLAANDSVILAVDSGTGGYLIVADRIQKISDVTATAAELNILDGCTASAAELNKMDGCTASTAELNKMDGVTATTAEINILDGVTSNATELNLLDGITTLSGSNTGDEPSASTSTAGIAELATDAEVQAGTDTSRVVTPSSLRGGAIVSGTYTTLSGSSVDFTSIPSWVKRITVILHGASLSGTDNILVQIGDSGGVETTSYISTTARIVTTSTNTVQSTSGFILAASSASRTVSGTMTLVNVDSNTWIGSHSAKIDTNAAVVGGGEKATSGTLDRVRITVSGSDTFDAGSVNIMYE